MVVNKLVLILTFLGRNQDGRTAWKLFVCLASMKYTQTNTKPSYTPRKKTDWRINTTICTT